MSCACAEVLNTVIGWRLPYTVDHELALYNHQLRYLGYLLVTCTVNALRSKESLHMFKNITAVIYLVMFCCIVCRYLCSDFMFV